MKTTVLTVAFLLTIGAIPSAAAGKDCNELKMEIGGKIEANGVKNYELTIVKNDEAKPDDNVVGTCGGGTMKIVYARKAADTPPPAAGK
jgi:hypothetical protein